MTAIVKRIEKGLGKVRMAKVVDIFDDGYAIDITLTDHTGDVWDCGDFTVAEIIHYAKRFIDESEAIAVIRLDRKVF
jgi:two-component SAPR family response regulator